MFADCGSMRVRGVHSLELAAQPATAGRSCTLPGAREKEKGKSNTGVRSELFANLCLEIYSSLVFYSLEPDV